MMEQYDQVLPSTQFSSESFLQTFKSTAQMLQWTELSERTLFDKVLSFEKALMIRVPLNQASSSPLEGRNDEHDVETPSKYRQN